jgi:hypothetical protein
MNTTYALVREFKKKYWMTINWWRTKKHSALVEKNLNPGEKVLYAFAAQNDNAYGSIFNTAVLALTTDRLIVAQDRLIVGYKVVSITPDLYNDITINAGLIWGMVIIDTMKEVINFSNIDKRALSEIQVNISTYMIAAKKEYARLGRKSS